MTNYFAPPKDNRGIEVYAIQGSVRLRSCLDNE
jgi:hypothetical protein